MAKPRATRSCDLCAFTKNYIQPMLELRLGEYNLAILLSAMQRSAKHLFSGLGPIANAGRTKHQSTKKRFWGSHTPREQRAGSEVPGQMLHLEQRPCPELIGIMITKNWVCINQQKSIFKITKNQGCKGLSLEPQAKCYAWNQGCVQSYEELSNSTINQ